jgi:hypothetical protein
MSFIFAIVEKDRPLATVNNAIAKVRFLRRLERPTVTDLTQDWGC